MQVDLSAYDFVDFGCSSGDSIAFGKNHLGGHRGLGRDINPNKVGAARTSAPLGLKHLYFIKRCLNSAFVAGVVVRVRPFARVWYVYNVRNCQL